MEDKLDRFCQKMVFGLYGLKKPSNVRIDCSVEKGLVRGDVLRSKRTIVINDRVYRLSV